MKIYFSKNKNILDILFYKIDFERVKRLLILLKINNVSIFIDQGYQYSFDMLISTNNFEEHMSKINDSTVIFDDEVTKCVMDKELEVFSNRKILIDYNLGENETEILVNLNNVETTVEKIKETLKFSK